jgi:hypothetical protein
MFYGRESISKDLAPIRNKISGVIHIPAPEWTLGDRWNDELRKERGYIQLADGTWVTEVIVEEYLGKLEKDILDLFDENQKRYREIDSLIQQRREMEFGLRHAQKSLTKAMAMKGDSDE